MDTDGFISYHIMYRDGFSSCYFVYSGLRVLSYCVHRYPVPVILCTQRGLALVLLYTQGFGSRHIIILWTQRALGPAILWTQRASGPVIFWTHGFGSCHVVCTDGFRSCHIMDIDGFGSYHIMDNGLWSCCFIDTGLRVLPYGHSRFCSCHIMDPEAEGFWSWYIMDTGLQFLSIMLIWLQIPSYDGHKRLQVLSYRHKVLGPVILWCIKGFGS